MNGPEHYREAERLLELSETMAGNALRQDGVNLLAQAQVHATLALAAATVASSSTYDVAAGTNSDTWCSQPGWPEAIQ